MTKIVEIKEKNYKIIKSIVKYANYYWKEEMVAKKFINFTKLEAFSKN